MTSAITIKCPGCRLSADFWFAGSVKVPTKDIGYFKKSKNFTVFEKVWVDSRYTNLVLHYHGLNARLENITDLPDGYDIDGWYNGYWFAAMPEGFKNVGSYRCVNCGKQRKHEVNWPEDAFFQIEYKGKILWAYDRNYALKLLVYIESKNRIKNLAGGISQDYFLRKIPEHFQTAKARDEITKKLKRLLEG